MSKSNGFFGKEFCSQFDPFEDFLHDIAEETDLHPALISCYRAQVQQMRDAAVNPFWIPLPTPPQVKFRTSAVVGHMKIPVEAVSRLKAPGK